jgi:hypothetical protein
LDRKTKLFINFYIIKIYILHSMIYEQYLHHLYLQGKMAA